MDTLVEERYKILFSQTMQKYEKEVRTLKDMLQAMAMEFQAVKSQMEQMRTQLNDRPAVKIQHQETQKALPQDNKLAMHPRQGNYKPEDVDIKKMFYFGHK